MIDFIPLTQNCKYCGDSNHWHVNDTGKCIAYGCICKRFEIEYDFDKRSFIQE